MRNRTDGPAAAQRLGCDGDHQRAMPLVSVVIPAYNRERVIGRALKSVLDQSYRNLEAIVVDDGSTDNTTRVVHEYASKDARIHSICHGARAGAQAARNTGVRAAHGEWIAFLDSDDEWLPQSLALRLRFAVNRQIHIVHSECFVSQAGTSELRLWQVPPLQGWVYRDSLRRPASTFPSLLVSKEAFLRIGGLDESIRSFQEWDTSIRLAKHYEFGFVQEPTFTYHRGAKDSISHDLLREAEGYEQVFTKHRVAIFVHLGPGTLAAHYLTAASLYHNANDEVNERRCVRIATVLSPLATLRRMQRHVRHVGR